jgi:hypothetical protein
MPGEPNAERLSRQYRQGAYPTHLFAGIVFAYMGPPDRKPPFPMYDKYTLPGFRLEVGVRMPFACNWVQVKENALDPAHTAVLHAWEERFADQFGVFPEFEFSEGPGSVFYLAVRKVGDKIWIRSTSIVLPNVHIISGVLENGRQAKPAAPPYMSFFTLPTDDTHCVSFAIPHVTDEESLERRMAFGWVGTGQTDERPYRERQKVPGDYDAQVGQGPIEKHSKENLGYQDRGVVLFRRMLRRGIEAVQKGEPIPNLVEGVIPSFGTDRVIPAAEVQGDTDDAEVLRRVARETAALYLERPPMRHLLPRTASPTTR